MGKQSKIFPSTKWRLGENVAPQLMECLNLSVSFEIFMDNYFISFRLLTHLGVYNIRVTHVFSKNRLHKCTIIGGKQMKEKERGHVKQRISSIKAV